MGCFARTCGISGTGINEDEKVVIIILNLPYKYIDLSTLMREVRDQKEKSEETKKDKKNSERWMKHVLSGKQENMKDYVLFDFKPIKEVATGKYDDYGFIKGKKRPEYDRKGLYGNDSGLEHLLFHVWAVEFLFDKKIKDIKLDIEFAKSLLWKIYNLRRSPMDWMLGQQHPDTEEMEEQIKMNIRTNEYLSGKIAQYKKEYLEYEIKYGK